MLGALALLFGLVFGFDQFKRLMIADALRNYQAPPVVVSAEPAQSQVWQNYLRSVGSLHAVDGVDISSQVGGIIQEIYFASGQEATEGQVLVQLDDSVERANLRSYKAQLQLAEINFQRDKRLLESRAISKTDFDTSEARLQEARAAVERTQALIAQKRIRAPFPGRLGVRQISVGQYVSSGDRIVTLQALDYLDVDFHLSEQHVPNLYIGQPVVLALQAYPDREFAAVVSAIDAKVNPQTRNILVRASFANDDHAAIPGMFADVRVMLRSSEAVITVPQTSISYSLYGDSLFVAEPTAETHDDRAVYRVTQRYIKVGDRQGKRVAIVDGLDAGELVVSSGHLKLSNNALITIDNSVEL
ncbi:MAG TPA: efflux RND transporter periplasmic adaptor subunit [Spongiibacteraceae bacterium]|nr:efflux RND transporter periplasmic adaptor subunit [Spongiibacteraceae bacterium]HUH37949.1 efflux RND transporter periplasmic adaptor subunit [Spongiibacteraceae bacterium]